MACNAALSQRQLAIAQQQFLSPLDIPDDGTMVACFAVQHWPVSGLAAGPDVAARK
jgi:hypothetical protein